MTHDEQRNDKAAGLYLDLLKKVLTNTIYTAEPGDETVTASALLADAILGVDL
jgi:hypothetical protein